MKKITVLISLLFLIPVIAQRKQATLFFRDGTELKGLARITKFNRIKFRENKKSIKTTFDSKTVAKIIIQEESNDIEYIYKIVSNRVHPILLKPIEKGIITIYLEDQVNYNGSISSILYLTKYDKDIAFKLITLGYKLIIPNPKDKILYHKTTKKIIKTILPHIKDCPELIKTINKKQGIISIAKYYNNNCK